MVVINNVTISKHNYPLHTDDKIAKQDVNDTFLKNKAWHFMQIISKDDLHEMSNTISGKKQEKTFKKLSANI